MFRGTGDRAEDAPHSAQAGHGGQCYSGPSVSSAPEAGHLVDRARNQHRDPGGQADGTGVDRVRVDALPVRLRPADPKDLQQQELTRAHALSSQPARSDKRRDARESDARDKKGRKEQDVVSIVECALTIEHKATQRLEQSGDGSDSLHTARRTTYRLLACRH